VYTLDSLSEAILVGWKFGATTQKRSNNHFNKRCIAFSSQPSSQPCFSKIHYKEDQGSKS